MAGRPTKEPGQKMDVPLRIMLTPTQIEEIRRAAQVAGVDVSSWARPVLLDAARAIWIVVSVSGREVQVQLMPTEDDEWKITRYDCPTPSSARGTPGRTTQTLFPTLPTVERAAEHVADLIRKGVIRPGEGHYAGMNIKHFAFAE